MPRILIVGCGFVGLATARLFHSSGWEVVGCTHYAESATALRGEAFRVEPLDVSDRESVRALADREAFDCAIHCASSGKGGADQYRKVYLGGMQNLAEAFPKARLVFTSSTSVYAQVGGEIVTEESSAIPDRETGQVLLQAEDVALERGGAVARLAGIYGTGRSVLLRKFFSNEAVIEGDGSRWINQIHRDDAAAALLAIVEQGASGVFNVSDDTPIAQRSLYEWLAVRFDLPLPPAGPIDPNRKRGWTHKRVANQKLRSIGWEPRYASFFSAVAGDPELVAAAQRQVAAPAS